jgi:hypothetical protein
MQIKITYSSGIPDETIDCPEGSDVHAIMAARFGHPNVLAQLGGICKQWEDAFAVELKKGEAKVEEFFHHTSAQQGEPTMPPAVFVEPVITPVVGAATETVHEDLPVEPAINTPEAHA